MNAEQDNPGTGDRLLITVTARIDVRGLGVLLGPGVGSCDPPVRIGERLRLVRPDGTERHTIVQSLHIAFDATTSPVLVLPELTADDIPEGTTVWAVGSR